MLSTMQISVPNSPCTLLRGGATAYIDAVRKWPLVAAIRIWETGFSNRDAIDGTLTRRGVARGGPEMDRMGAGGIRRNPNIALNVIRL